MAYGKFSAAADNGSSGTRFTFAAQSGSLSGVTELVLFEATQYSGRWTISSVTDTTFDVAGLPYSGSVTGRWYTGHVSEVDRTEIGSGDGTYAGTSDSTYPLFTDDDGGTDAGGSGVAETYFNLEFNAVESQLNNLTDLNFATNAAIAPSKIAATALGQAAGYNDLEQQLHGQVIGEKVLAAGDYLKKTGSILSVSSTGGEADFYSPNHGLSAGNLIRVTGTALQSGTIASVADNGSGQPRMTDVAHGLTAGQKITITGTTSYNGTFRVGAVPSADTFDITELDYVSDQTGTWTTDYNGAWLVDTVTGTDFFTVKAENASATYWASGLTYGGSSTGTWQTCGMLLLAANNTPGGIAASSKEVALSLFNQCYMESGSAFSGTWAYTGYLPKCTPASGQRLVVGGRSVAIPTSVVNASVGSLTTARGIYILYANVTFVADATPTIALTLERDSGSLADVTPFSTDGGPVLDVVTNSYNTGPFGHTFIRYDGDGSTSWAASGARPTRLGPTANSLYIGASTVNDGSHDICAAMCPASVLDAVRPGDMVYTWDGSTTIEERGPIARVGSGAISIAEGQTLSTSAHYVFVVRLSSLTLAASSGGFFDSQMTRTKIPLAAVVHAGTAVTAGPTVVWNHGAGSQNRNFRALQIDAGMCAVSPWMPITGGGMASGRFGTGGRRSFTWNHGLGCYPRKVNVELCDGNFSSPTLAFGAINRSLHAAGEMGVYLNNVNPDTIRIEPGYALGLVNDHDTSSVARAKVSSQGYVRLSVEV